MSGENKIKIIFVMMFTVSKQDLDLFASCKSLEQLLYPSSFTKPLIKISRGEVLVLVVITAED
jgi:hypothetical protein